MTHVEGEYQFRLLGSLGARDSRGVTSAISRASSAVSTKIAQQEWRAPNYDKLQVSGRDLVEQHLRRYKVRRIEALCEPGVGWRQYVVGFFKVAVLDEQPREIMAGA
jgi:hypothetical protein